MKNQTLDSIIPSDYTNSELQRAFFKQHIGKQFKFNTQFMERMQEHKGKKTYQEAITEWERLHQERKNGVKYPLKPQFAYNQYTRDFFADNPWKTRQDGIKCWNTKKTKIPNPKYERTDLSFLL